ncbi:MAG: hypothetical protein BZY87_10025 [SAR202 cluster bacterium Io17-Chloro-G6]|nr:MAG: hypothetical protein BZY87_10025 [SAR202 cluster bacterium Io17-Chloro-G6]
MRVLFDHGTPVPIRNLLDPHQIETAYERGRSQLSNGDLLAAAQLEGFDVFVATDKNISSQQNLDGLPYAIVVLGSTSWPRIQRSSDTVKLAIDAATPGIISVIEIP